MCYLRVLSKWDDIFERIDDIVSEAKTVKKAAKKASKVAEGVRKRLISSARMTINEALDAAEAFLGEGYKEVARGVFCSKDGLRQVRMTDEDITGTHGSGAHINFEIGKSITNPNGRVTFKVIDNIHIYLTEHEEEKSLNEKIKELKICYQKLFDEDIYNKCYIEVTDKDEIVISANKEGFLLLIEEIIKLCENEQSGNHYHLDGAGMANKCDKPLVMHLVKGPW
ncbi:MAG: hypothetical protein GX066_04500 [Clostridiaceae bacterium]|nr:hypothetical protein [Clostridiaceae bacterium]